MPRFAPHFWWLIAALAAVSSTFVLAQQAHDHPVQPTVVAGAPLAPGTFFGRPPDPARTHHYYIAAEPQVWDYAPQGLDPVMGKALPPNVAEKRKGAKIRYVQYTNATFTSRVMETTRLGVLGPTLRGIVGDYLEITFVNRTDQPLSLHPHGVKYDKDSEGAYYMPSPGRGAAVGPGATFTYVWYLDEASGPQDNEPSSKGWLYHSHVKGDEEVDLGLVGSIIVTDPRRARADGTPADVDREMVSLFKIFDESGLGQAAKEAAEYGLSPMKWPDLQEKLELGARYAINGYVFGNTPGLEMNQGERVRWYLFGLGSEADFHTAHWHGLRVVEEGRRRTDVVELLPASMKIADMVADNAGTWLFQCHVAEHMMEGMYAPMVVHPANAAARAAGPAFLGSAEAQQSLAVTRSERTCASGGCSVRVEGAVTVPNVFSVQVEPITLEAGGARATFKADTRGTATSAGSSFRVTNANEFGVVYGGVMRFEAVLAAPGRAGDPAITLQIGAARHVAHGR